MKVTITFRHMEATDAIRNHVDTQLGRLEKYLIKPIEIHVILSVEKFRHRAEVVAFEQHFKAQADEVCDDLYLSIDRAIDKVVKQIKKHKEKIQEHHKHHNSVGEMTSLAEKEYLASLNRDS